MTSLAPSVLFWAIAAVMTAVALAFVLRPLLARRALLKRSAPAAPHTPDAHRTRAVAARRTGFVAAIAVPLSAIGLYATLGEPGALDTTAGLDAAAAFESTPVSVMREDLTAHLARNARDARGWVLLARLEFAEDRFTDAAEAFARALAANPKVGNDPEIWCEYADALGMAQGGSLTGKPHDLVLRALIQNPAHPRALEMAGSASFAERDYAAAISYWRALAVQLVPASPARRELEAAIAHAELLASSGAH
jgi:cytochrome c-type biogenesis protein CcmH